MGSSPITQTLFETPTAHRRHAERHTGTRCGGSCRAPSPSQAHCAVCHRTFSGVSYFDDHRRDGCCIDPTGLGLTDDGGLWSTPEGHERRRTDAARLAKVREAA